MSDIKPAEPSPEKIRRIQRECERIFHERYLYPRDLYKAEVDWIYEEALSIINKQDLDAMLQGLNS